MNELILYGIILGVWFVLQLWVFPKLGIPTCMSGACGVPAPSKKKSEPQGKYEGAVDLINKKE
ncbi:MAG: hypothetical protein JXX29_08780 [Deltaproteobacteria bacterium]|nr:hypothetical protein [Deltaproteobacteria bacterium]MBN2671755.1 hypothetical protein [Deltaproteobacteria bacterium]